MTSRSLLILYFVLMLISFSIQSNENISIPASFKITTDIVNKNIQPFSATTSGFGNSLIGSGFEPLIFRNKFIATQNSPNKIYISEKSLTNYDSFREGYLDNAKIQIYRITNGRFNMVREDIVTTGGTHASGWVRLLNNNKIISPKTTTFEFQWDAWNRANVDYFFTIRAVDKYGNISLPSPTFKIAKPDTDYKKITINNKLISFKPKKSFFSKSRPPAPKTLKGKLTKNGTLILKWNTVDFSNIAGYYIYRSDYHPNKHSGYYLDLRNTAQSTNQYIKKGDMIIVSKKLYSSSRKHYLTNRVWNARKEQQKILPRLFKNFSDENINKTWSFEPHLDNTPVKEPGETYLKLQLKNNTSITLSKYTHAGTKQSWYNVLEQKPYTLEIWMKQDGKGSVQFDWLGRREKKRYKIKPITFNVGKTWKKYTATFTPTFTKSDATPNEMILKFTGTSTFYVDNFRIYRSDTPFLAFLPRQLKAIKSSKISALRTHGLVNTRTRTYNMEQLTNTGGLINGTQKSNTLPQTLKAIKKAEINPWLQIEFHMSPQEWLAYVEYMAAPYNPQTDTPQEKPWAYKRYKQGQIKPWVDEFEKIYFELSNETWNGLFRPWNFIGMTDEITNKRYSPGEVYGMFQEYVISIMRKSPYWKKAKLDKKFNFVLGGWAAKKNYSKNAALSSISSNLITIAGYNGGWDENEGPPKIGNPSLFNVLAQVNQVAIPIAKKYMNELRALPSYHPQKLFMGTYEAGPGYAKNGLNGARVSNKQFLEQEHIMKSLAAGTATLDSFLARAYYGFTQQNYFTFNSGPYWTSHAKWYRGGHAYPSWKLISLFNNKGTGDMLRTETLSVPSVNLKSFNQRQSVKNAPLIAIYATKNNHRFSLFVISRKIPHYPLQSDDGYTPVNITLPFKSAKSVQLYRMTGEPSDNNVLSENVTVKTIKIDPSKASQHFILNKETGADERGIPPASTFLYVFEDVSDIMHQ